MNNFTRPHYVRPSYVLEGTRYLAVLTSLVNVAVFSKKSMRKKPLLQYLLIMSITDAVYSLSLSLLNPFYKTCMWDQQEDQSDNLDHKVCYYFFWYIHFVAEYFTSCLVMFNIIIEILVTFQRMILVSREIRRGEKEYRPWVVCAVLFTLSLAVYSPVLLMNQVKISETRNETSGQVRRIYAIQKTVFGKSAEAILIEKVLTITRIGLVTVVLTVVNIIASVKFSSYFKHKHALKYIIADRLNMRRNTPEYIADRKMTLMLILVSFLCILGNIPYTISYLIRLVYKKRVFPFALTALYILIILKTFIYYGFNSVFRRSINEFILKLFCFDRRRKR